MKKGAVLLCIALIAFTNVFRVELYAQTNPIEAIASQLAKMQETRPQEKLYLHFDKPFYAAGDIIWFKAYLLDASSHKLSELSKLVYVELINPSDLLVKRLVLKQDKGNFNGSFKLSDSLPEGNYQIRAYTNWMRNWDEDYFFKKSVPIGNNRLSNVSTLVKYEISDDTSSSAAIAHITFSDNNDERIRNHALTYETVRIGASGEETKTRTDSKGHIAVPINLDNRSLYPNKYLRVTINYDGLPFVKEIFLPSFKTIAEVTFFPESGNIVAGLPTRIAFKVTDINGKGLKAKGTVFNTSGKKLANIRTVHNGMGEFVVNVTENDSLWAKIQLPSGETVKKGLPAVQSEGYLLNIIPTDTGIRVRVAASSARLRNRPVYLIAQTRGKVSYAAKAVLEKELYSAIISKSQFPSGITQFTLFDMYNVPVAERLVFVDNQQHLTIKINPDKANYDKRANVRLDLLVTDADGTPSQGDFSISVTDQSVVEPNQGGSIINNLLLSSDLRGNIENPSFYFSDDPKADKFLDLVMLTHGWRRFVWEKVLANESKEIAYPLELGLQIAGEVTDPTNHVTLDNVPVFMLAGNKREGLFWETTTDDNGRFEFSGYDLPDSSRIVLKARNEDGRREGEIEVFEDYPDINSLIERYTNNINQKFPEYMAMSRKAFSIERGAMGLTDILLSPVYVIGNKITRRSGSLHSYADNVITSEQIERIPFARNVLEVMRGRVPGLRVVGNHVIIRGRNTIYGSTDPLVVVDGTRTMGAGILTMINPLDVESIEILKGANAAIYGMGSANGVIVINTKRGEYRPRGEVERRGLLAYYPKGYHVVREFYMPDYTKSSQLKSNSPDLRSTIYWNGNIQTDNTGRAIVRFFTADNPTQYNITIEGVSHTGNIGHGESNIDRK